MNETPTDRRARLERLCEQETGKPAVGDAFLDWLSGYYRRCEADEQIVHEIAQHAVWVQVELRTPQGVRCVSWTREDGVPVREWLAREVGRIGAPEVVRVAAPVGAGEVGDA